MTSPVTLPLWLVALLVLLAAIALVDRIFAPSVRWFFRSRFNNAIDKLNERLDLNIQPFRLTRRQSLIDNLMVDRYVIAAIDEEAKRTGIPRRVIMRKAEDYAREIVPSFSPIAYFGFGTRAAKWLSKLIYRVRLGHADDEALHKISPDSAVVFVMNHRSNMDYVLVTYMAAARASLSYAVGEWARVFGLQTLIKAMGAYFIRRKSGDDLYRRVLARYVHMATAQGVTQAVFPEGGLSRDGRLGKPRLGLLSYMLTDYEPGKSREIVLVPTGINYDRVLEDRLLTSNRERELTGRDFSLSIVKIIGFLCHMLRLRMTGKLYRFGYASVSFGTPMSLTNWLKKHNPHFETSGEHARFETIEMLGHELMERIGNVVPVLPVSLAATVFVEDATRTWSESDCHEAISRMIDRLEAKGIHINIPRDDRAYAVTTGLRMLKLRKLITTNDQTGLKANPNEMVILQYYANSVRHLLEEVESVPDQKA